MTWDAITAQFSQCIDKLITGEIGYESSVNGDMGELRVGL